MKIAAPPGKSERKATGGLRSRREWGQSGATLRKDGASLHRGGGSSAGSGPGQPGVAGRAAVAVRADSFGGWSPTTNGRGTPAGILVALSLLLARLSEQVSACGSHIPFLSYKHNQTKLSKCIATACKRRTRLRTLVIWRESNCCNKWELFIFQINFFGLFAKFLFARLGDF